MIHLDGRLTRVLFALIRAGLWPEENVDAVRQAVEKLSPDDWKRLFRTARAQAVTGIFTDGLKRLDVHTAGSDYAYLNGIMHSGKIERRNRLIIEAAQALTARHPGSWVFKGPQLVHFYPTPLHRETGDIDLVVPGLKEEMHRTINFRGEAVCVEFHPWPEYLYSPCRNRLLRALVKRDRPEQKGGLSLEVNLLCMMLHIRRHILSDGFGLKQLCDVAVVLQTQDYNKDRLYRLVRRVGCEQFVACLMKLLTEELGLTNACPVGEHVRPKAYALLRRGLLEEGYDNKQAWRDSSGWMESARLRWSRCLRMYPLVESEALWMPFHQALQRRKRHRR